MKKKKIYANKNVGKKGNNQKVCEVEEIRNSDNKSIDDKLNELFNRNGYIFNVDVKIITNNKTYDTKIASMVGNSLITLDNDIINIDDVKDIIF